MCSVYKRRSSASDNHSICQAWYTHLDRHVHGMHVPQSVTRCSISSSGQPSVCQLGRAAHTTPKWRLTDAHGSEAQTDRQTRAIHTKDTHTHPPLAQIPHTRVSRDPFLFEQPATPQHSAAQHNAPVCLPARHMHSLHHGSAAEGRGHSVPNTHTHTHTHREREREREREFTQARQHTGIYRQIDM